MKSTNDHLYLQDILLSLSNVVDLMNPALNEHHKHVAYIAYRIAVSLGCSIKVTQDIVLASLLHDIGAFSEQERLGLLSFDDSKHTQVDLHAEVGYRLLRDFAPFTTAAHYIRFHHRPWKSTKNKDQIDLAVPLESHIIHLADRIAVLIKKDQNILRQVHDIRERISDCNGLFHPELVEAFLDITHKEEFWLNTLYDSVSEEFCDELELVPMPFSGIQFDSLVDLFRRIIDFRSAFTSVHSCGVAATATIIARIAGFSPEHISMIKRAGELHDLGKIAIPSEILEKPTPLSPREFSIIRTHPYHTDRILRPLPFFDTIRVWAAQHHERMDGTGYPFHANAETLSLGSRIIMAADVFTALTEDRPYRKGMLLRDALGIMHYMVNNFAMDQEAYMWVNSNADEINQARILAQEAIKLEYQKFAYIANSL